GLANPPPGRLSAHRIRDLPCSLGTRSHSQLAEESFVLHGPKPRRVLPSFIAATAFRREPHSPYRRNPGFDTTHRRLCQAESHAACPAVCRARPRPASGHSAPSAEIGPRTQDIA